VTRGERLFNKNAGDCKSERMSTVSEACPAAVGETLVQQGEAPQSGGGNSDRRNLRRSFEKMISAALGGISSVIPCRLNDGLFNGLTTCPLSRAGTQRNCYSGE